MPKISIILPTRERPSSVYRLLESITKTADNPKELEVIIYIDEDDIGSRDISYPALSVIKLVKPREKMGKITNLCYHASAGDYIFLMNDDVVFQTPHWDTTVIKTFSGFPDGIALVYGNDLYKGKKIPTFPILSRRFCELMDGACPDNFIRFHIEYHIFDIFRKLRRFGFDRIFYLPDVVFEHLHYLTGKSLPDETYLSGNSRTDEWTFVSFAGERHYLALKLAQYIKNHA